jgi:Protein of unknown function (DUF1353)
MPFESAPPPQSPRISGQNSWFPLADDRPEVLLRGVGPLTFQLIQEFFYTRPSGGKRHRIKAHDLKTDPTLKNNSTDLASVPMLFWWLIASYGRQTRAALIHDQLYDRSTFDEVMEANGVFRDALAESSVPLLRRWIMWAAVDAAGRWRFGWAHQLDVGLEFLAAFGTVLGAGYWALGRFWGWWPLSGEPFGRAWLIPTAIAGVGLLCWRRRWLSATLGVALVLPPLLPELFSRGALWTLEWAFYPFAKHGEARGDRAPIPRPTFGRRHARRHRRIGRVRPWTRTKTAPPSAT